MDADPELSWVELSGEAEDWSMSCKINDDVHSTILLQGAAQSAIIRQFLLRCSRTQLDDEREWVNEWLAELVIALQTNGAIDEKFSQEF